MMRVRMRTRPAALFGAFLLIAALVFLPMRLVLGIAGLGDGGPGDAGLTARDVTGTVWAGRLHDARFGNVALGDLDARLSPLSLLLGRARVSLGSVASVTAPPLSGTVTIGRHRAGVGDMTAQVRTGRAFAPLPVESLDLDRVTATFADGRCEEAGGRLRAGLGGDLGGVTLPPTVAGGIRCDAGALLVTLASQAGTEAMTLRIEGDGRYRAMLAITPSDPATAPKLEAAGFTAEGNQYRLSVEGRF